MSKNAPVTVSGPQPRDEEPIRRVLGSKDFVYGEIKGWDEMILGLNFNLKAGQEFESHTYFKLELESKVGNVGLIPYSVRDVKWMTL